MKFAIVNAGPAITWSIGDIVVIKSTGHHGMVVDKLSQTAGVKYSVFAFESRSAARIYLESELSRKNPGTVVSITQE